MISNETFDKVPGQPSDHSVTEFNYTSLETETRTVVLQRTTEIKSLIHCTALNRIEIGQKLIDVKERLGHGEFRKWLKAEFSWGVTTAWKQMKVAQAFKCSLCEHLDIAPSAFYLLTASSTSEQAREEALERARAGETITPSIAEAIVNKYKESVDVNTASEPVTVNVPAEIIEQNSDSLSAEVTPVQQIEQNQPLIKKEALIVDTELPVDIVGNSFASAAESEQELLRKELETEPLFENSKPEQAVPLGAINGSTKDQRAIQLQQENTSVTEICKNLTATIDYLYREDIIDLVDPLSLKSLVEKLTLLVEKTEVSLKKRFDSSYSNN